MSAPDLDQLRARWAEQSDRINDRLVLDVDAVRAMLERKTSAAFAWHQRRRVVGLVAGCGCVAALAAFIVAHWGQWDWVWMAALLLPLLLAEVVLDLREWLALRRLDLDAPIMQVRELLHKLRWRRLRLAKGYLLLSLLLWWPLMLVLFKGLFGFDLLHWLDSSVLLVNLAVGLAFIPVALVVSWGFARWYGDTRGWQRFLDDSAGKAWRRASDEFAAREAFESAVADGSAQDALESDFIPEGIREELHGLRRRLLLGILSCAALVLLFGLFNLGNGGQPRFLIPSLVLLWGALVHMLVQILNREALWPIAGGVTSLRERLSAMLTLRRRVALVTLVLSPILAVLLAIVVGRLLFDADLIGSLPAPVLAGGSLVTLLASASLGWHIRRNPASRLVDLICLGLLGRMRGLLGKLPPG